MTTTTKLALCATVAGMLLLAGCGGGGAPGTMEPGTETAQPDPDPTPEPGATAAFALPAFRCLDHYGEGFDCDLYTQDSFDPDNIPTYNINELPAKTGAEQPTYHDHSQLYGIGVHDWGKFRRIFVGLDVAPERLSVAATRGNTRLGHGVITDGVEGATLAAYMVDSLEGTVVRWEDVPDVALGGRPTQDQANWFRAAVELVNAALPQASRMEIVSPSSAGVTVEFRDYREFPEGVGGTTWNVTDTDANGHERIVQSTIHIDEFAFGTLSHRHFVTLLAHELLHSLGLGHVSADFDTIMEASREIYRSWQGLGQRYEADDHGNPVVVSAEGLEADIPMPMSIVYPIDRAALQVLYGRLDNGDSPTGFGAWTSNSLHVAGSNDSTRFGVQYNNGHFAPWAHGYMPDRDLAQNGSLGGSATWKGALVGFTPGNAAVAGDAVIGVNLATMSGRADFTGLEHWAPNAVPGASGTGTTWLDGTLGYSISATGNTFRGTGGDGGRLTGIFTGHSHDGAAGTLERDDLTAAFGASRQ